MFNRAEVARTNPDQKIVLHTSTREHAAVRGAAKYTHKSISDVLREALDLWMKAKHIPRHILEGRG